MRGGATTIQSFHNSMIIRYPCRMKTNLLAFLFSFIFLFCDFSIGFGEEPEIKKEFWKNGKKRLEEHYKNGKLGGLSSYFYESGI